MPEPKAPALRTYEIRFNEFSGRFCVYDKQIGGRLVGAGFSSMESAAEAFSGDDNRRTRAPYSCVDL